MKFRNLRTLTFVALAAWSALGQGDLPARLPPENGPQSMEVGWHVLRGGTVHLDSERTIEKGVVEIRDGRIVRVGPASEPVAGIGAREWDTTGHHIYPGLIESYIEVDAPAPDAQSGGVHWSAKVTPQRSALDGKGLDAKTADALRRLGFCAAAISPKGGVFRGRAAVVSTEDPTPEPSRAGPAVLKEDVYQSVGMSVSFSFGDPPATPGTAPRTEAWPAYPSSLMGTIAVIRQTLLDADWAARVGKAIGPNADVGALGHLDGARPILFDVADEQDVLRAGKLAAEFHRTGIVLGTGREFRRLSAIAKSRLPIIVPLDFPDRPKVSSVSDGEAVDLREMMSWEQSPTNLRRLVAAGVQVAITSSKLRDRSKFRENLRLAIRNGLSESTALRLLTVVPATILGIERVGTLDPGNRANVLVTDGPLFGKDAKIRDVWIDGRRHEITPPKEEVPRGDWSVTIAGPKVPSLELGVQPENKLGLRSGDQKSQAKDVRLDQGRLEFVAELPGVAGALASFSAVLDGDRLVGTVRLADGSLSPWSASRIAGSETRAAESREAESRTSSRRSNESGPSTRAASRPSSKPDDDAPVTDVPETFGHPFGPYAHADLPLRRYSVLLSGATVWTSGPQGVIENGFVLLESSRIKYVGARRPTDLPAVTVEIDCRGKHVTPGLIDCHSHTGIARGVNEGGEAVSAEVRVEDVTDADAISWYRQLAGGITTVNSLHGSANAIGGQNCINKNRWGAIRADDLHFRGAPPGIKFALGENPRGANSPPERQGNPRYPQTRLGVEALIRDRLTAGRDYAAAFERWRAAGRPAASEPRRDLELDAMAEILAGTRLVHCHSYRQDEILMLCRLSQEFGFKLGTFQHVLEGYKVADAIKETSRGGSTFSDWWGYKLEVQDAIPENGAIMHEVGVTVSFNSDSDELARRMNLEAAKAVRYGHVTPEEALKFVTINPARQLAIDATVGSLEAGKDADLVIWSGHPLSVSTKAEQTWVDGRPYFTLERDAAMRKTIADERTRLVQKILASAKDGPGDAPPDGGPPGGPGGRRRRPTDHDVRGDCGCSEVDAHE